MHAVDGFPVYNLQPANVAGKRNGVLFAVISVTDDIVYLLTGMDFVCCQNCCEGSRAHA
jgi:hypothetical protein